MYKTFGQLMITLISAVPTIDVEEGSRSLWPVHDDVDVFNSTLAGRDMDES